MRLFIQRQTLLMGALIFGTLVGTLASGPLNAAEPGKTLDLGPSILVVDFEDRFESDSRQEYQASAADAAQWQPDRLTLKQGTTLSRSIGQGSLWTRLRIGTVSSAGDEANHARLRFGFAMHNGNRIYAELVSESIPGDQPRRRVVLHYEQAAAEGADDGPVNTLLREVELGVDFDGSLGIEHRVGMIKVFIGDQQVIHAVSPAPITIGLSGWVETVSGPLSLSDLRVEIWNQESYADSQPEPTTDQQQELDQLDELAKRIESENKIRNVEKTLPLYARQRELYREIWGVKSTQYRRVLKTLAEAYRENRMYQEAKQCYLEALELDAWFYGEDHLFFIQTLEGLRWVYDLNGKFTDAIEVGERIYHRYTECFGEESAHAASVLKTLANLYGKIGDYSRSKEYYLKAIKLLGVTEGVDTLRYANALGGLAGIARRSGEFFEAENYARQAVQILRTIHGSRDPWYADSLHTLAVVYYSMNDIGRAETLMLEAREIFEETLEPFHPLRIGLLNSLAGLYLRIGDRSKGIEIKQEQLRIQAATLGKQHIDYAASLESLADLHVAAGRFDLAQTQYAECLDILGKSLGEAHPRYLSLQMSICTLDSQRGEHARAIETSQRLLADYVQRNGDTDLAYTSYLANIANFKFKSGLDYRDAQRLYLQALEIRTQLLGRDHSSHATLLSNLASTCFLTEQYDRAYQFERDAQRLRLQLSEQTLPTLSDAQAYMWMKANPSSPGFLLSVMRLRQPDVAADSDYEAYQQVWATKGLLGRTRQGRTITAGLTAAAGGSPAAVAVAEELRDARRRLAGLVSLAPKAGELETYLQALSAASDAKEKLEKQLASLSEVANRELELRKASVDDLIESLPKGTAVIDITRLTSVGWQDSEPDNGNPAEGVAPGRVRRRTQAAHYHSFVVRSRSDAAENQVAWVDLGPVEPIDDGVIDFRREIGLTESPRGLGSKSQSVAMKEDTAGDAANVGGSGGGGGEAVADDGTAATADGSAAKRLRALLWDRWSAHLRGCDTVIIVADGELLRLPWAALPGAEPDSYLIEQFALSTASSGQQLVQQLRNSRVRPEVPTLLVAGGIRYDERSIRDASSDTGPGASPDTGPGASPDASPDASPEPKLPAGSFLASRTRTLELGEDERRWAFLPYAEKEAVAVSGLWGSRGRLLELRGLDASEASLSAKLPQAQFVHLATHGFFDQSADVYQVDLRQLAVTGGESENFGLESSASAANRNPMLMTGLVLAGANIPPAKDALGLPIGEDGILTAEEIVGLDLSENELITLSACETGLGEIAFGEGVLGLQRVLHEAGARTVIASLWKVEDAATEVLMTEFYRNLWDRNLGKLESLRQSQLRMIRYYDAQAGEFRGLSKTSKRIEGADQARPDQARRGRLPAALWAAFQLSGDWR